MREYPPCLLYTSCKDEIIFYEEIFDYIWEDLNKVNQKGAVVTEGAAYFPHIMKKLHVPEEQYAAITPTKDFQISHYKEREWVPYILEGCSDKEKAFQNWMGRDSLFADTVCKECMELNYLSIINDCLLYTSSGRGSSEGFRTGTVQSGNKLEYEELYRRPGGTHPPPGRR